MPASRLSAQKAFTLVEMCVVLIIIGLLITAIFPALTALSQSTQKNITQNNLQTLLRATAVYVQSNGCLPCPTPLAEASAALGLVRGDEATSPAACGTCSTPEGLVPFISMGLPLALAKDGWGRWIRMRVDPALTKAFGVVPPTLACTSSDSCTIGTSAKGLCKTSLDSTNRIKVLTPPSETAQQAAVLFLSHGANGFGAYIVQTISTGATTAQYPFPPSTVSCAGGGYESCNANASGAVARPNFVNAEPVISALTPYDDIMIYMDRNNLVSLLGNNTCQTPW